MFYHDVQPDLVKFARFWITLATSVSFLDVFSSGYSEHRKEQTKLLGNTEKLHVCVCWGGEGAPWQSWNRLGERMAGQMNRRKMEPLINLKLAFSFSGPNR